MLSLNTFLPPEVIRQSKKLQNVKCEKKYQKWGGADGKDLGYTIEDDLISGLPAPTIADVLDNAEMLFGITPILHKKKLSDKDIWKYQWVSLEILRMCQQNKTIEEVSQYILDNIK